MRIFPILLTAWLSCVTYAHAQSSVIEVATDFSEREVMVYTSSGNLYGTLVIPLNNELGIVSLIIPDFGLTDRDGNSPQVVGCNSLKMLAEDLARKGISSLRIEKREVTESKNNTAMVKSGVRIEDMVEDAVSWLRFLKADKRFSKVAVIGHGEGALVGMLAAEIADIKYFVSIAGTGRAGYEIVEDNLTTQLTAEQMDTVRAYLEKMKKGDIIENVEPSLASVFNPSIQPYLISWFKYNPVVEIANLKANVLLVTGTSDLQANPEDMLRLAAAYPKAEELVINKMNHKLKVERRSSRDTASYSSLADGLVEGVAQFLKNY